MKNRVLWMCIISVLLFGSIVYGAYFVGKKTAESNPTPKSTFVPTSEPTEKNENSGTNTQNEINNQSTSTSKFDGLWEISYIEFFDETMKQKDSIGTLHRKDFSSFPQDDYGYWNINGTKFGGPFGFSALTPNTNTYLEISQGERGLYPSGATRPISFDLVSKEGMHFLISKPNDMEYEIQYKNNEIVIRDAKSHDGLPAYHFIEST